MCKRFIIPALLAVGMTSLPVSAQQDPLRDPTRPLGYQASESNLSLTLNAIWRGSDYRLALINGQRLREGDTIANSGGVRLLRVREGYVIVGQEDRQWQLTLNNESVRRTRSSSQ